MLIPYIASNFPPTAPPTHIGIHDLPCSWTDIVWSAITAGKPGVSHLLAHRWHSLADLVVRTHTIYASLRQRGQFIDRSTLYDAMDPTEKGATSYFLGMAMAKLFAAELFNVPWLFHVSQATIGGVAIVFKRGSKSQPDLIGQSANGEWIVVEAKGRTNGHDSAALTKAKAQTLMIQTINGINPFLRVALQVYFNNAMSVRIDDPTKIDRNAKAITLDLNEALSRYYAITVAMTSRTTSSEAILDRRYITRFDEDTGITIGLDEAVLKHVSNKNFDQIRVEMGQSRRGLTEVDDRSAVYPDGMFIRLDDRWSSRAMELEPEKRSG